MVKQAAILISLSVVLAASGCGNTLALTGRVLDLEMTKKTTVIDAEEVLDGEISIPDTEVVFEQVMPKPPSGEDLDDYR